MIGIYSLPTILPSSTNPGVACHNEMVNLTASGAVSYTWISNTSSIMYGGNSINVIPGVTSVYTVTGTNANGCSGKTTVTQNVQDCTGLNEFTLQGVKVYPNPTTGVFTIELNNNSIKNIRIADITGRLVLSLSSEDAFTQVDVSKLAGGIYYVSIHTGDTHGMIKLVKE
jgi:hypothetical protein